MPLSFRRKETSGPCCVCKKEVWPPTLHSIVFPLSNTHHITGKDTHTQAGTLCKVTDLLFSSFTLGRFNLLVSGLSVHF